MSMIVTMITEKERMEKRTFFPREVQANYFLEETMYKYSIENVD